MTLRRLLHKRGEDFNKKLNVWSSSSQVVETSYELSVIYCILKFISFTMHSTFTNLFWEFWKISKLHNFIPYFENLRQNHLLRCYRLRNFIHKNDILHYYNATTDLGSYNNDNRIHNITSNNNNSIF